MHTQYGIFLHREMWKRVRHGFRNLLPAAGAVRFFRYKLKLSHISVFPQEHCRPPPKLNMSEQPDEDTPSFNNTIDMEVATESMQFGCTFPCALQEILETDSDKGPVRVSKLGLTDAYHRGTRRPSQVGAFTYVIPSADYNDCIIICFNLVLPIRWVDSPKYFFEFSETLTNVVNSLVHMSLPVPG